MVFRLIICMFAQKQVPLDFVGLVKLHDTESELFIPVALSPQQPEPYQS